MSFEMLTTVGMFIASKTANGLYNKAYGFVFESDSTRLQKKLDKVLENQEQIHKEIENLKKNKLIEEYNLENDNDNNEFELVFYENYIEEEKKNLVKSCPNISTKINNSYRKLDLKNVVEIDIK